MSKETRRDFKFYTLIAVGTALCFIGLFLPPIGYISNSVLIASGLFLSMGGMIEGIDIKGCIRELRLLKSESCGDENKLKEIEDESES